jgi:tetratricopeptide (TPR) repeat protein
MKSSNSIVYIIVVFVIGFISGTIFSAWKLENVGGIPERKESHPAKQDAQAELRTRIAGLEKMLSVKKDEPDIYVQLGNDYFDLGEHEKAIQYYTTALTYVPNNADVMTDLAISYRKSGKPQQAVKYLQQAIDKDPNHSIAMFNLGIILRDDLKDETGALKIWETFLEKSPDSPHAVMIRPWVKQLQERVTSKTGEAPTN